jgi:hypothetical protein
MTGVACLAVRFLGSIAAGNLLPDAGQTRRPDPNSNARLWTSLFTGRPVGFLELYPFLPDGAHFVPGKQTLIFDVCNAIG